MTHQPQTPMLTLVSPLVMAQISIITPIVTLLPFLVLMAASQGQVLLTSLPSS